MQELKKPPIKEFVYIGFRGERMDRFGAKRKKGVCYSELAALASDDTNFELDAELDEDDELGPVRELLASGRRINFIQMNLAQYNYLRPHVDKVEFGLQVSGDGVFEIADDVIFEKARYLWLDDNSVGFHAHQTPALEFLSAKYDRARRILDVAEGAPHLASLYIGACPADLDNAAISRIVSLQISASSMQRLPFEHEMANIETLWLHSLDKLESFEDLQHLTKLSTLKIYYCKRAKDYDHVLALPNLKTIDIVGCKPDKGLKKKFESKDLKVVNFT